MVLNALDHLNYNTIVNRLDSILIRENGSYMPLKGNVITETILSNHFPIKTANIVICENDKSPEPNLVKYLKEKYPNKSIQTINFFDLRTDDEIKEYFSKADVVSFYTTLSNTDWFEKMVRNIQPHNTVIGYCVDNTKWDYINSINEKIEKIIFD